MVSPAQGYTNWISSCKHQYLAFSSHPQDLNLGDLAPEECVAVILLESSGPALRQCHREAECPLVLLAWPPHSELCSQSRAGLEA